MSEEVTTYVVLVHSQAQEIKVVAEKVVQSTSGSVVSFLSGDGSQLASFRLSAEGSGWWVKEAGKQSRAARPA